MEHTVAVMERAWCAQQFPPITEISEPPGTGTGTGTCTGEKRYEDTP